MTTLSRKFSHQNIILFFRDGNGSSPKIVCKRKR
jgi:hypothetical protein